MTSSYELYRSVIWAVFLRHRPLGARYNMSLDKTSRLISEAIWPNFLKFLSPPPAPSVARTWCVVDQTRWSGRGEGGGGEKMKWNQPSDKQTNIVMPTPPLPLSLFPSLSLSLSVFYSLPSSLPPFLSPSLPLSLPLSPPLFYSLFPLPKYLSRNWVGGSGGGDGSGRAF